MFGRNTIWDKPEVTVQEGDTVAWQWIVPAIITTQTYKIQELNSLVEDDNKNYDIKNGGFSSGTAPANGIRNFLDFDINFLTFFF